MFPQIPRHTYGYMHEHVCIPMHSGSACPHDSAHRQVPYLQMCLPGLTHRCMYKLTFTPSNSHGAACPPEHIQKYRKSTAALMTWGLASTPARISKREKTLPHVCGWAVGGVHGHSAALAGFPSSQHVPNIACGTRGSGKRRSQSPR